MALKSNIVSVKRKRFSAPIPPIKRRVEPLPPALSEETKRRLMYVAVMNVGNNK